MKKKNDNKPKQTEEETQETASVLTDSKEKVKKVPKTATSQARVNQILAKAKRPSVALRNMRILEKMAQKNTSGKRKTLKEVGVEEGLSEDYASRGKFAKTDAWSVMLETHPAYKDSELAKHHEMLLNAQRIGHQTFGMGVKDEEIIEVVESFGFPVMKVLFVAGLGKVAYYSIPDHIAKKYALEMSYKLKQKYGDITVQHKFGELSDEEVEDRIAGIISGAIGAISPSGKKKRK